MNHPRPGTKMHCLPWYYYGTYAFRNFALQVASALGMCPISVIYYHRVADQVANPWTISNGDFCRQIDWLADRFDLISLQEAQHRLATRCSRRPAVCITFDDGYAENCERALPMLIERRIPVTYFVATQFVLENKPFPHDVAQGQPFSPNTVSQLRSLANAGIEIGAHTRTHPDLGSVTAPDKLIDEIVGSRDDLQQMLGREIRYFAFPYGQYHNLSVQAVRVLSDAGFVAYCSAYGGYNFPGGDSFHLQRLHADPQWWRFKNWLTFDPRIALFVQRWEHRQQAAGEHYRIDGRSSGERYERMASELAAEETFLRATAVNGNDR